LIKKPLFALKNVKKGGDGKTQGSSLVTHADGSSRLPVPLKTARAVSLGYEARAS